MRLNPQRYAAALLALLYSIGSSASDSPQPPELCQYDLVADKWRCAPSDQVSQTQTSHTRLELDWLPRSYLGKAERQALAAGCSGAYIDPLGGTPDAADLENIDTLPLVVEADSAEVVEVDTATLEGAVRVSQGPRSIAAEHMSYERQQDKARLEGNVSIRQPGMLIRGDEANISTVDHKSEFKNARFVLHKMHMRGAAGSISQDGPDKIVLRDGAISSCEPDSKAWSLEGQELSVDSKKGQGYGKNVRLKVGGVPVFYLPYISFPVGDERRSGFLFPSISSSDDGGLDVSAPYYLNLAPNYDMTLTPRLITGRGAMLETELRHLNSYFYTEARAAYLGNDSGGNLALESEEESVDRHQGSNRWLLQLIQAGGLRQGWYTNISYTKTSDTDYFRDLGTSSFSVANTTYLNQSVDGGVSLNNWHLYARVQDYQTLLLNLDAPYRKVPEIAATGIYELNQFNIHLHNNLTRFDHRDPVRLDGSPIITGERFAGDYRIKRRLSNAGAYIASEAGYKVLAYRLSSGPSDPLLKDNVNLTAGQFSVDAGAVFEHTQGKYLQTLEPRAKYFFREYEDHSELYSATSAGQAINFDTTTRNFSYGQLYRDTRFSGSDRLDDANQVTIGLTNRWFGQDGHEFFNASFGQINHFRNRRIGLEREVSDTANTSEWAAEFGAFWRNGSTLYGNVIYDDGAEQIARFSTGYNYASEDQLSLYSLGYSYVRADPEISDSEELDQVDAALVAPLAPQWFAMARANYDLENQQELETFIGFEYNDCCYRVRLLARRWLDSNIANLDFNSDPVFDQGLFFELHLKGLGGSGAKLNQILEDAIPGYSRRENILNKLK